MPEWLAKAIHLQSSVMMPTGNAWPVAIKLVRNDLDNFLKDSSLLALGLVEDWSNSISMDNPYPAGYQDAAAITFELMEKFGGYRYDKQRKKLFGAISKNPLGDKDKFIDWITPKDDRDRDSEEFGDFLIEGSDSWFFTKEMPNEAIELCKRRLYFEKPSNPHSYRSHSLDVDQYFGMESHREFFPPSALRGPFLPLLRFHFWIGLDFIIEFVNRACSQYIDPLVNDSLEEAWEVVLTGPNGSQIKQWHNPRFWQMYRGTSVGPQALFCALMALEYRLLEVAKSKSMNKLDEILVYILSKSNNSALSAVVASLVVAHPKLSKGAAKIVLSCRDFVEIDQQMAAVNRGSSVLNGMFPSLGVQAEFFGSERKESDSQPHRNSNLIFASLDLQTTEVASDIHAIIDSHLSNASKDEAAKMWRFTLHKMDLRKYKPKSATRSELAALNGTDSEEGDPNDKVGVVLEPLPPESDIVETLERDRPRIETNQTFLGIYNWAWSIFNYEGKADPSIWRSMLQAAIESVEPDEDEIGLIWSQAPALVGAVCARDHWNELKSDEKNWCIEKIGACVQRDRDSRVHTTIVARHGMSPDRACAMVTSAILAHEKGGQYERPLIKILSNGLFHACEEVSVYAANGVGQFLLSANPDLASHCAESIAFFALESDTRLEVERKKPYNQQNDFYEIRLNLQSGSRRQLEDKDDPKTDNISKLDFEKPCAGEALKQLLQIFNANIDTAKAKAFYENLSSQIEKWRKNEGDDRVPFETVYACQQKLASYVLRRSPSEAVRLVQPIINLVNDYPKEASGFLRDLIYEVDKFPKGKEAFWAVWNEFAHKTQRAHWIKHLKSENFSVDDLFSALFLNISWKKGVRKWEVQEGNEERVISLFNSLPSSRKTLDHMSQYLTHVGDVVLPEGFIAYAAKVKEDPDGLFDANNIFFLEQTLQRYVYGMPKKLKQSSAVREAVIFILDALVEKGSSAAFKMRDDFVTPLG